MRLTGLTSSGDWSNPQYVATDVDPTGLTFTANYSDGSTQDVTATVVSQQSYTPTTWENTVGTQTCVFSYTEDEITVTCDVEATVEAPVELDHIEISGDFTNNQIRGTAPDLTGLTIKAVYTDESEQTLTDTDYEVSPAVWPMGNPDNLAQARVTVSYTDGEITKTAYKQPTLHYPTTGLEIDASEGGHVYFDMSNAEYAESWKGPGDVAMGGGSVGDKVYLVIPDSYYQAGTTYPTGNPQDLTVPGLMQDMNTYGINAMSDSGTINTEGYVPVYGVHKGNDISEGYFAACLTGGKTIDNDFVIHNLIGTLANNISAGAGWSINDLSSEGLRDYVVTFKA